MITMTHPRILVELSHSNLKESHILTDSLLFNETSQTDFVHFAFVLSYCFWHFSEGDSIYDVR